MKAFFLLLSCVVAASPAIAADGPVLGGPSECRVFNPIPVAEQSVSWDGVCKQGYAEGTGTLVWRVNDREWSRYQGPLRKGLPHGQGKSRNVHGVEYSGGFVDGKREGQGVWTSRSGIRYQGGFRDGRFEGQGSIVFRNKTRYDGQFHEGARHGRGRAVYAGGQIFEGMFAKGEAVDPLAQPPADLGAEPMPQAQVVVDDGSLPPDRPYASLRTNEQGYVRLLYPLLHRSDEPPYPLRGIESIERAMLVLSTAAGVRGKIEMYAVIDARGTPQSVGPIDSLDPLRPLDPALVRALGELLMKTSFKPALCAGKACEMEFRYVLTVSK